MSHFGITAIRWNAQHTEVELCMLHEIAETDRGFEVLDGKPAPFDQVANLIACHDKVWVMEKGAHNAYDKGSAVLVKQGQQEYLYSEDNSLFDLPTF